MASLNKVYLIGNLCRDPEMRFTPSGKAVCKFGIAVNGGTKDKKEVTFLNCVAWEKTAEAVSQCLHKGSAVMVEGRISVQEWETDAGEKRKSWEIVANNVQFLGGKGDNARPANGAGPVPAEPPDDEDYSDSPIA